MIELTSSEKLCLLRAKILEAKFAISFEDDYELFERLRFGTNCYAYALQLSYFLQKKSPNYHPGFLSNIDIHQGHDLWYQKNIVKGLLGDCEALGIEVEKVNKSSEAIPDSYKIALGYCRVDSLWQFHFLRENTDGTWSEKNGWEELPNKDRVLERAERFFPVLDYYRLSKSKKLKGISY